MFETIFVADDGHSPGRDALRLARYLATPESRFVIGSPSDATATARRENADLVVVGAGRDARLLGEFSAPVAVAPAGYAEGPEDRLRVIGVGFDARPESLAALRAAEQLALEHEATMRVYAVVPPNSMATSRIEPTPEEYRRLIDESLERKLHEEAEALDGRVRAAAHVSRGDSAETLIGRTSEGLDLLVVGSRGYGPVRRVLFGSVSSQILARAECPVLVLPREAGAGDPGGEPAEEITAAQ